MDKISKKIRKTRREKNMTLKELSEKAGLSVSFLSQVERGISSMTITSLKNIADALDVPMKELVDVEESSGFVHKRNNQVLLSFEKSFNRYMRLSGKFRNRQMEAMLVTMEPNFYDNEEATHEGEEFYYVLEGEAIFIIDGVEYKVGKGEAIHYPSSLVHKTVNPSDEELVMVSIITPPIF